MKTYILIPLALLSFASVALTENRPYYLATVLFYNDEKGHQAVARGRVLKEISIAIKNDIKVRFGDIFAKVVPLFKHYTGARKASNVVGFVKQRFDHVYLVEIPAWLASKAVQMQNKIKEIKVKTDKHEDFAKVMRENEQVVETNSIAQEKINKTDILSKNNIAPLPRTHYMPNTVVYAVEGKCKTPNAYSCNFRENSQHHEAHNLKWLKKVLKTTTPWYSHLQKFEDHLKAVNIQLKL